MRSENIWVFIKNMANWMELPYRNFLSAEYSGLAAGERRKNHKHSQQKCSLLFIHLIDAAAAAATQSVARPFQVIHTFGYFCAFEIFVLHRLALFLIRIWFSNLLFVLLYFICPIRDGHLKNFALPSSSSFTSPSAIDHCFSSKQQWISKRSWLVVIRQLPLEKWQEKMGR